MRTPDGRILLAVDPLDLLLDPLDRGHAFFAAPHQHNALHDVVVVVLAGDSKSRLIGYGDRRHIADDDRHAPDLGQHRIADFVERSNKSHAANDSDLWADVDRAAADIDVAVVQRLLHLRQRYSVGDKLVHIDLEFIGLRLAAPARHIDDARHRAESALQHPILQGLEFEHVVVGGTDELVTVDFSDRADRRNLRLRVVQQRRQLREAIENLLKRLLVSVIERELQLYVRKAVERDGADRVEVAQRRSLGLNRNGDIALDLLCGEARALSDDVHHRRGGIRIRFDIELAKSQHPANERHDEQGENEHPLLDRKRNQRIQENGSVRT